MKKYGVCWWKGKDILFPHCIHSFLLKLKIFLIIHFKDSYILFKALLDILIDLDKQFLSCLRLRLSPRRNGLRTLINLLAGRNKTESTICINARGLSGGCSLSLWISVQYLCRFLAWAPHPISAPLKPMSFPWEFYYPALAWIKTWPTPRTFR